MNPPDRPQGAAAPNRPQGAAAPNRPQGAAAPGVRLTAAADRVAQATRAARLARIEAADDLRARARRRSRWVRRLLAVFGVLVVALAITAAVFAVLDHRADARAATDAAVLDAAGSAATTMLTSDPAHAEAYVNSVLAVTTGTQRDRVERVAAGLAAEVAAQPGRSSGRVISAGLVTDPDSDDAGARADVLLVVQASNPALIGGDAGADRLTVTFTMIRGADDWLVESAVPV